MRLRSYIGLHTVARQVRQAFLSIQFIDINKQTDRYSKPLQVEYMKDVIYYLVLKCHRSFPCNIE